MTDHYVPALRQRFLEDMRIKGLQPKTQTMYLRAMREFTRFLGHSPDSARLCCTNPVRDSSRESRVVAGMHEQTHTPNLQDQELAGLASH